MNIRTKYAALSLVCLCIFLAAAKSVDAKELRRLSTARQREKLKLIIPNETWEPIFFEAINERAKKAKLRKLRSITLPADDLEIRIWVGFGISTLEGLVIKRASGQWSAVYLRSIYDGSPRSEYQRTLSVPKTGWQDFWKQIVNEGILKLPDATTIRCRNPLIKDGTSYVVEINMDNTYRTYLYDNPNFSKCDEATRMIKIADVIAEEFGLTMFSVKNR